MVLFIKNKINIVNFVIICLSLNYTRNHIDRFMMFYLSCSAFIIKIILLCNFTFILSYISINKKNNGNNYFCLKKNIGIQKSRGYNK